MAPARLCATITDACDEGGSFLEGEGQLYRPFNVIVIIFLTSSIEENNGLRKGSLFVLSN